MTQTSLGQRQDSSTKHGGLGPGTVMAASSRSSQHATEEKPILVVCSERSGSNLIRLMLDAHPLAVAPNTMALGHVGAPAIERSASMVNQLGGSPE